MVAIGIFLLWDKAQPDPYQVLRVQKDIFVLLGHRLCHAAASTDNDSDDTPMNRDGTMSRLTNCAVSVQRNR
jgi:hypothetical protein